MKTSLAISCVLFFAGLTGSALGCARAESGAPACADYTRADVVFLGKIVKIEDAAGNDDFPAGSRKIRFQVLSNFKGADNPTISVVTAGAKNDCGLKIKTGETWIVYAGLDQAAKFFREFRGRKVEPKGADSEAETLKAIAAGLTDSVFAGRFATAGRPYADEKIEVTLRRAGGKSLSAATDAEGAFSFAPLAAGKYRVRLAFPYRASLVWDEYLLNTNFAAGATSLFDYEIELREGDCLYNLFDVRKVAP
jgi:hypothetical protein